jgi:two-component system C4-dicarboxylate transport response regulator DctD
MISNDPPALRVLVVDDEPLIRWSLAQTLIGQGHDVEESADAVAARAAVGEGAERFDVVLLDYRLPDSDNLSLLASIRDRAPRTQVILMTAYGGPDLERGALALGAYRVIAKPFDMSMMADLVVRAHADRWGRSTH